MNLNPTYYGQCSELTKEGTRCRHTVIFVNGKCKQHGGETPPEYAEALKKRAREKQERQRARLLKRIDKLNRKIQEWQQPHSKECSPTGYAKASTAEEPSADAGSPT